MGTGARLRLYYRKETVMTKTMKAAVLTRFGGPDAFELREVPVPEVGARQVRVRVHATAVNPLDYQIRRGDYTDYVPLPAIIGHDISGVVEELGSDVREFAVGDEVYYTPKIFGGAGSYAEQHVADVELVGRKPQNLTHVEAASLALVGGTVWEALVERAQLRVGETILIHGGAGGVTQQRRLAEFATILGDYKLATSVWEGLRKEGRGGSVCRLYFGSNRVLTARWDLRRISCQSRASGMIRLRTQRASTFGRGSSSARLASAAKRIERFWSGN